MLWDEGDEPYSSMPLAAAMDVVPREASARIERGICHVCVYNRIRNTHFKGSANQLEKLAPIRSLADKSILLKQL